jgi:hypothetical protein
MLKRQRHGSKLGTRAGAESTEPRCGPPRCWQRSQRLGGPARRRRRPWRSRSSTGRSVRGGRWAAASGIGKRLEAEKPRERGWSRSKHWRLDERGRPPPPPHHDLQVVSSWQDRTGRWRPFSPSSLPSLLLACFSILQSNTARRGTVEALILIPLFFLPSSPHVLRACRRL